MITVAIKHNIQNATRDGNVLSPITFLQIAINLNDK